jgi:hypothetical protein
VVLEFIEIRRSGTDRYSWTPFEFSESFDTFDWWDRVPYWNDNPWHIKVLRDEDEVGRLELDETVELSHYGLDRDRQSKALEIQFIEVSANWHLEYHTAAAVHLIAERQPVGCAVEYQHILDDIVVTNCSSHGIGQPMRRCAVHFPTVRRRVDRAGRHAGDNTGWRRHT